MFVNYDNDYDVTKISCESNTINRGVLNSIVFRLPADLTNVTAIICAFTQSDKYVINKEYLPSVVSSQLLTCQLTAIESLLFTSKSKAEVRIILLYGSGNTYKSESFNLGVLESSDSVLTAQENVSGIFVRVNGTHIDVARDFIPTGTKSHFVFIFNFDYQWSHFTEIDCSFKIGDITAKVNVVDNTCIIPEDVLKTTGELFVSLFGKSTNEAITTEWADAFKIVGGQ